MQIQKLSNYHIITLSHYHISFQYLGGRRDNVSTVVVYLLPRHRALRYSL
jgi:hypothetical protein